MVKRKPEGLSQADWDAVESAPLGEADVRSMRPAEEVVPAIVARYRRRRGPQKAPSKQLVSLRLDRDVIEHFRSTGDGWQTRINLTLRKAIGAG
jgi:uncharacterized protein (DUF4415 family)